MFDRKKDFKCNDYGMRFDDVGLEICSKTAYTSKHGEFEQKWYWGN